MSSRVKPCPRFPQNFRDEPYRAWRIEFVHWIWQHRLAQVCEGLLSTAFIEALKDGASGVHQAVIQIDPRVLAHPGRPRGGLGPWDPGELSGVVWYVVGVLDADFFRLYQNHEDGRRAREDYYKVTKAASETSQSVISRQDRAYNQAQVLGNFWLSNETRTDELFRVGGLSEDQKSNVMLQVGADRSRYSKLEGSVAQRSAR